jgi:dihydroorotate dehydrogenase
MEKVYAYAGYIAINISSPNTPGLRTLQYGEALDDLLSGIKNKQRAAAETSKICSGRRKDRAGSFASKN